MKTNQVNQMPLKNLIQYMKAISDDGYNVWIEGKGDGTIRLVVESQVINLNGDTRKDRP